MTALVVEYSTTADMDGQPLPPIEGDTVWHVVKRCDGCTRWRGISLSASSVTDWRTVPEDHSHAPLTPSK